MSKKSDLVVMQEMSQDNMDIRCSVTVVECKKVKGGVSISFGIDDETGQKIMKGYATDNPEYYCVMYVINKKQFNELKKKKITP